MVYNKTMFTKQQLGFVNTRFVNKKNVRMNYYDLIYTNLNYYRMGLKHSVTLKMSGRVRP